MFTQFLIEQDMKSSRYLGQRVVMMWKNESKSFISRLAKRAFIRKMSSSTGRGNGRVKVEDSRRFMNDCFLASKTSPKHAKEMADLLVEADIRGHFSHGMNRLEMYINDLHAGATDGQVEPEILQESPATAWVDGKNGLGASVGNFCMDLAMAKACEVGVGMVAAKGCNHYGMAGWYAMRAQQAGLIGMSMTNSSPLVTPTRSKDSALGTNPLSFAAPAEGDDSFLLDMATSAVALGKIEFQRRKGQPLPHGWAQDKNGIVTTDANLSFDAARLMPLGGDESTSGYKGYGLSVMVEVLCGILAGANFSTGVRSWSLTGTSDAPNLGQFFMAINPKCFAPGFEGRMTQQNAILRGMTPVNPEFPVMVAGDKERKHIDQIESDGGIQYVANQLETCKHLAERLKIKPIVIQ